MKAALVQSQKDVEAAKSILIVGGGSVGVNRN
jgi:heterodisulfide reductase subunit A-like polyferredoxin